MEGITRYLTTKLKLKVNQAKSAVAQPKDRKFLGFSFTGGKEPRRRIAPKAILRFKERIRELTCRTRGISMEQRAQELSEYLRGWRGYFGFCQTPSVLQALDEWLRRRLRSALLKQWRLGSTKFAKLRARGIGRALAAQTAASPHGPWRLANSPALTYAFPNSYFDSLGVPRLLASH
jgi:RNA-directed DNA polymerase